VKRDYWKFKMFMCMYIRPIHTRGGMYIHVNWSRDFMVGIESRLRSWGLGFEYRQGQRVFVFSATCGPDLGPIKPYQRWKSRSILWSKAAGAWICHSPPSSSEFKSKWSYAFTPSVYLYGMDRDNFTLLYKGDKGYFWVRWGFEYHILYYDIISYLLF